MHTISYLALICNMSNIHYYVLSMLIYNANIIITTNGVNNNSNNKYRCYKCNWSCFHVSRIYVMLSMMTHNILQVKADPMCDIIAATNIQSISGYSQWSCTTGGVTTTTPCTSPVWNGLTCSGTTIISIYLGTIGLTGDAVICVMYVIIY